MARVHVTVNTAALASAVRALVSRLDLEPPCDAVRSECEALAENVGAFFDLTIEGSEIRAVPNSRLIRLLESVGGVQ